MSIDLHITIAGQKKTHIVRLDRPACWSLQDLLAQFHTAWNLMEKSMVYSRNENAFLPLDQSLDTICITHKDSLLILPDFENRQSLFAPVPKLPKTGKM
jgi:hypothetical protein